MEPAQKDARLIVNPLAIVTLTSRREQTRVSSARPRRKESQRGNSSNLRDTDDTSTDLKTFVRRRSLGPICRGRKNSAGDPSNMGPSSRPRIWNHSGSTPSGPSQFVPVPLRGLLAFLRAVDSVSTLGKRIESIAFLPRTTDFHEVVRGWIDGQAVFRRCDFEHETLTPRRHDFHSGERLIL
jgi:hypothetical protein